MTFGRIPYSDGRSAPVRRERGESRGGGKRRIQLLAVWVFGTGKSKDNIWIGIWVKDFMKLYGQRSSRRWLNDKDRMLISFDNNSKREVRHDESAKHIFI